MAKPVRLGTWNKLPNYECPYCSYATLVSEEAVQTHILARHSAEVRQEAIAEMQAADAAKAAAAAEASKPAKSPKADKQAADSGKE
jgi:hypothetical protein